MTLSEYLKRKYGPHSVALSRAEAKAFGIRYPLKQGWLEEFGYLHLTRDRARRILASFTSGSDRGGKCEHKGAAVAILEAVANGRSAPGKVAVEFARSAALEAIDAARAKDQP